MMSTWSQSAPPLIIAALSSARRAKSADRMLGAIFGGGAIVDSLRRARAKSVLVVSSASLNERRARERALVGFRRSLLLKKSLESCPSAHCAQRPLPRSSTRQLSYGITHALPIVRRVREGRELRKLQGHFLVCD